MVSAPDEKTTKVYYYLDDSTPYVSVVPVHPDQICLGDFKKVFNRKDFKYFCKELDNDIGREVKVELTKDDTRLKKSPINGLIELFLLPANQGHGTLPRKNHQNGLVEGVGYRLNKRRSMQALSSTNGDIDMNGIHERVSMLTTDQSNSAGGSMHTRRAGEHLADIYTSNSEDPYKQDENSTFSMTSSSFQDPTNSFSKLSRKRKPRKDRYRKPYVPSTISSATESSISYSLPRVEEIILSMKDSPYLGISVVSHDGGIFVSNIKPGGAADRCGIIEIGDQIVQVNQTSFENLTDKEAIVMLKKVAKQKKPLTMYVAKRPRTSDQKSDALSALCETLPVDVSLWVEMTTKSQAPPLKPFETTIDEDVIGEHAGSVVDMTSDEERAAYMDRRNGIGAHFVPVLQTQKIEEALRLKENEENEKIVEKLTIDMNPIVILRYMARPDSGLQIKNRKWLKIPVPMSFIGDEMVDWLFENVHGFKDRKAAKSYAAMLLEQGHIRHVVNKLTFTEKCYYVFEDSIAAERRRYEQAKAKAESNTEVTYVSEQSSPFLNQQNGQPGNGQIPLQQQHMLTKPPVPAKPPLNNFFGVNKNMHKMNGAVVTHNCTKQTWPISPIVPVAGGGPNFIGNIGHRDCDSPMTNDYASMIQGEINGGYATTNASNPAAANAIVPDPYPTKVRDTIENNRLYNGVNGTSTSYAHHGLLQASQSKIRSVSPPPPNTPNTLSGSSICLIPPLTIKKPT